MYEMNARLTWWVLIRSLWLFSISRMRKTIWLSLLLVSELIIRSHSFEWYGLGMRLGDMTVGACMSVDDHEHMPLTRLAWAGSIDRAKRGTVSS